MIMINGNWEQVKDLSDVLRIVSENIDDEFAQKVEEIIYIKPQNEFDKSILVKDYEKEDLIDMISDAYDTIERNNKTIHILLKNCASFEDRIAQMKKERKNI